MLAIGPNLDVGGARFAGMGMGGYFRGYGQTWAIVVAIDGGNIMLVIDGGGTWGGLI